jgi:hypothetical protein
VDAVVLERTGPQALPCLLNEGQSCSPRLQFNK